MANDPNDDDVEKKRKATPYAPPAQTEPAPDHTTGFEHVSSLDPGCDTKPAPRRSVDNAIRSAPGVVTPARTRPGRFRAAAPPSALGTVEIDCASAAGGSC